SLSGGAGGSGAVAGAASIIDISTIKATGTGYVFTGQAGAVGTANKGILPYAIIASTAGGLDTTFATADSVTGVLRALTASEVVTTLTNNAGGVATPLNVSLSTSQNLSASITGNTMTINSLTLNSGGGVSIVNGQTLTLDSGGLLAFSGNTGISGGRLSTTSNREMIVHALGDLTISSTLTTFNAGLSKAGAGILTLGTQNFYNGITRVNEGTLKLAGGTSTIFWNNALYMNGGELDLNGGSQVFNTIRTEYTQARNSLYMPDTGGVIVNSSLTEATLGIATAGVNFSGSITGNIAVVRSTAALGFTDWNLYSANDYTGKTIINGGRVQLLGEATLSQTEFIEITQGTLLISNNNATAILNPNIDNRINDAADILMRGGMLQYTARNAMEGFENFGALTLGEGNSAITVNEPGTGVNSSTATFDSLSRLTGSRATLRFFGVDGTFNNSQARVYFDAAPVLTRNIIGGWAVFEREFASYSSATGVGALNGVGYAGYAANGLNDGLNTDNIRLTDAVVTSTGTIGTNVLTLASNAIVGLKVGDAILGNGIPTGARITAISGNDITLNQTLGAANPNLTLPQQITLTGSRTLNSLALLTSTNTTLNLGGNTLNLESGGLIVSQGFNLAGSVSVVTSSTTSNIVTVATVPNTLVVGSSFLGSTVASISGLTITLVGNANALTTAPTNRLFLSALEMPINITNG
ncbi:MAG: autotransporter-associated beta strand repeat-containing protein, partial [Gammaproteobacteria bacterium]|nr:autotransporter-associated beta strand repeat-containing protein [Gammaproteobacteria bacterium]